ncbi:hypothetical protein [Anaeroselena agilis]|uniref:Uncharacterized protein n=1 Tax=Anaeroselena agilis TaxID=3063788 RepID=A0ABU3P2K5_9FIRM|nr:hypothetical protein [Selenomonadales bacterium 4137-cl]
MNPDEELKALSTLGVELTRRGFLKYEERGHIPQAHRGGGGPGGAFAIYPPGTTEETYAAWALMHGEYGQDREREVFGGKMPKISPQAISFIRMILIMEIRKGDYPEHVSEDDQKRLSVLSKRGNIVKKGAFEFEWILGGFDAEPWLKKKWVDAFLYASKKLKRD